MENSFLIDAASDAKFTREDIGAAVYWMTGHINALSKKNNVTKPKISLVIANRFLAAKWITVGLLSECIVNPVNPDLPLNQIDNLLDTTQPDLVITDIQYIYPKGKVLHFDADSLPDSRSGTGKLEQFGERYNIKGDLLLYTSGTTGLPKGILLESSHLLANVQTAIDTFELQSGWVTASILPLFHTFTIVSDLLIALLLEGICVICECCTLQSLPSIFKSFKDYQVNTYSGVPIMFQLIARFSKREQCESIKFAIAGAAPLSVQTQISYKNALKHPIIPCYGMTEAACFITISPVHAIRPDSVGKPCNMDLIIVNENGKLVELGERGEICIKGPSVVTKGYYREENVSDLYLGEYLITGDIGRIDANGYVYITGRSKNMMIKGGEKFYLEDVDSIIITHKEVSDCASIVLSNDKRDDEAACFLVIASENTENLNVDLRRLVIDQLGHKAVPKYWHIVNEVPRTPTNKPKMQLLKMLHDGEIQKKADAIL